MIALIALVVVYFLGCWGLQWWTRGMVDVMMMMFWPLVIVFSLILWIFMWPSSLFKKGK